MHLLGKMTLKLCRHNVGTSNKVTSSLHGQFMEENKVLMETVKICVQMCISRTKFLDVAGCCYWSWSIIHHIKDDESCHIVIQFLITHTLSFTWVPPNTWFTSLLSQHVTLTKSRWNNGSDILSIPHGSGPLRDRNSMAKWPHPAVFCSSDGVAFPRKSS